MITSPQAIDALKREIHKVIVGKDPVIERVLITWVAGGHVLLEDVPGTGKTRLTRALAAATGGEFRRIQFTPDLLPSDITGGAIYNEASGSFQFQAGPLFANLVLADEINRATPRTQSALLEAMEEQTVSAAGETRPLPQPFMVMATQNPVEQQGTFPLPEAQLDRFLMRLAIGYPDFDEELEINRRYRQAEPLDDVEQVLDPAAISELRKQRPAIYLDDEVQAYILEITRATREHDAVELGASPRATLALTLACQARALLANRDFVLPDDVKFLAEAVLAHRLVIKAAHGFRGLTAPELVRQLLEETPVPVIEASTGRPPKGSGIATGSGTTGAASGQRQ